MVNNTRWRRATTLAACLMSLTAGTQTIGNAPATAAAPGLIKVTTVSETGSRVAKTIFAPCPPNKRVVGGGGRVFPRTQSDNSKLILTQLRPMRDVTTGAWGYSVRGEEIATGATDDWFVEAYAVCATVPDGVGYNVVPRHTASSSQTYLANAAVCPQGRGSVIGTGAEITSGGGQVTLQLTRPDYPRSIARAGAKERAAYSVNWTLSAYAICVNPDWAAVRGFTVELGSSPHGSEDQKFSQVSCGTRSVHGPAAVIVSVPHTPDLGAPAGVGLQAIFPRDLLGDVDILAVETVPTTLDWETAAHAVCG